MATPKVISESKVKFSDDTEITVCLLDDGRRIIPETDMLKAMRFFGLLRIFFGRALPIWRAVVRLPKPSEEAIAFAPKNPVDFSHGSM